MMIELLILRHAKSDWSTAQRDFDRPLAPRGQRAAPKMAQWLDDNDLPPDRILSSSAVRARQTADFVIEHFGLTENEVTFSDELYLAGSDTWLD
ncbi:MAG: histidine phosphatase family protein, partial [Acidimicrobiales bacterium]|nr:histidine phosphatase family protein [Acidimicrobiales bacterium]